SRQARDATREARTERPARAAMPTAPFEPPARPAGLRPPSATRPTRARGRAASVRPIALRLRAPPASTAIPAPTKTCATRVAARRELEFATSRSAPPGHRSSGSNAGSYARTSSARAVRPPTSTAAAAASAEAACDSSESATRNRRRVVKGAQTVLNLKINRRARKALRRVRELGLQVCTKINLPDKKTVSVENSVTVVKPGS